MNTDSLIDTILRKCAGRADDAEVFFEASESRPVDFENNQLKYVATKSGRGVGLRVIKDGRLGFSSTSDFNRLDELVQNALESASFGEPARFQFPDSCSPQQVKTSDDATVAFTTEQMAVMGQAAIDRVRARHPDVQCSAEIGASSSEETVANSRGLRIGHRSTSFAAHVGAFRVNDQGFLWVGDGRWSARLVTDIDPIVDKVVGDLDLAKTEAAISTGAYPVIFTPSAMGVLLISLSQGVNGKLVQKGASPLSGKIGESIADPRVSAYDDALIDYAEASAPHDTEGIASRRLPIVEKGVLANFLYDLQTAGIMNAKAMGNGLRGHGSPPAPGHNNTVIATGDASLEDMVRGIRRGLLVDSVLGAGQSNTLAGEFSLNLELGFLIENGSLAGRVKNCMVFGNVYDLLRTGIDAIGDTPEMKASLSCPHFCFKQVSVAAQ